MECLCFWLKQFGMVFCSCVINLRLEHVIIAFFVFGVVFRPGKIPCLIRPLQWRIPMQIAFSIHNLPSAIRGYWLFRRLCRNLGCYGSQCKSRARALKRISSLCVLVFLLALCAVLSPNLPAQKPPNPAFFNVMSFGAVADGKTPCTAAVQKAVEACAAALPLSSPTAPTWS